MGEGRAPAKREPDRAKHQEKGARVRARRTNGLAFEPGASARWLSRPPSPGGRGLDLIGHIPFSFWVSDFDVALHLTGGLGLVFCLTDLAASTMIASVFKNNNGRYLRRGMT